MPENPPGDLVRVAGTALHVVRDGDSGPVVLLDSGLGGCWLDWDSVVPALRHDCRVVRFDRPGLGWSQASPLPPTLAGETHRLRELLRALELDEPCVLVGHSMAGFHVEAFARTFPELTRGVVLVDGSAEPDATPATPATPGAWYGRRVRFWRGVGDAARLSGAAGVVGPALRWAAVAGLSRSRREEADPARMRAVYGSGRFLPAALVENATYRDVAAELLELRAASPFPGVPLRVLAATGGWYSRVVAERWTRRQRELAAMSPLGELTVLPDSGHLVQCDRPDAIVAAVREVCGDSFLTVNADASSPGVRDHPIG